MSLYLFTLVLDVLIEHIQGSVPWCILVVDDIIPVEELREEINEKLELWREALEAHDFRISRRETKYIVCKFGKKHTNSKLEVEIGNDIIPQVTIFKYLIQNNGEIDGDINYMIQVGWLKWRSISGNICD